MEWVNSGGGPLICAEAHISAQWMGIDGLSANSGVTERHDYGRACGVQDYLEAMACASGYVLVLGDEPLQSSFFRTYGGDVAIARWVYAQSRDDVEGFLAGPAAGGSDVAPPIPFVVTQGPLVLFDSALRGVNALARCPKADVQPGSYRVTTEKWQLERRFNFVVHRLRTQR
jgi:Immunity protein 21